MESGLFKYKKTYTQNQRIALDLRSRLNMALFDNFLALSCHGFICSLLYAKLLHNQQGD